MTNIDKTIINIKKFHWNPAPIFPGCQKVDLSDYLDLKKNTPTNIAFFFRSEKEMSVELMIQERNRESTKRLIPENRLGKYFLFIIE